ncbi:MAG: tetratricopeptide repeat protein [Treponema sp.]|nr:tetratricopeptide repeat protein [Treponema sp.]
MNGKNVLADGIKLYKNSDYSGALTFFLSLPEHVHADDMELSYYIGLCYAQMKRYDDALLYLEQVVTGDKNQKRVLQCRFLLAVIYCLSSRKRLADFELKKLLDTGYKPASVYAALAYVAWDQKSPNQSISYYEKALSIDPENATALNGLGYVLACENKDLAKALGYCKKALEKNPDDAACLDSLGWVYFKLGMFDDARKYLKLAFNKAEDNEEITEHYHAVMSQ